MTFVNFLKLLPRIQVFVKPCPGTKLGMGIHLCTASIKWYPGTLPNNLLSRLSLYLQTMKGPALVWQADCSKIQKSFLNHSIFVLKTIQCIFQTIQCNAQFNSIVHSIQCIFNSMLHSIQCIFNSMPTSMPHSIQFNDEKCSTHALRKKITDQVCSDVIGSEAKMPARTELEEGVMAALLWW